MALHHGGGDGRESVGCKKSCNRVVRCMCVCVLVPDGASMSRLVNYIHLYIHMIFLQQFTLHVVLRSFLVAFHGPLEVLMNVGPVAIGTGTSQDEALFVVDGIAETELCGKLIKGGSTHRFETRLITTINHQSFILSMVFRVR